MLICLMFKVYVVLFMVLLYAISLFKYADIFRVNPMRLSCWSNVQYPKSLHKYSILLTSAQLPLAILRNLMFVDEVPDSLPSAMLFIIETAAR